VTASLSQQVERYIGAADTLYTRLILIVGPPRSGKSVLLRDVQQRQKLPLLNVNLRLSEKLLDVAVQQRPILVADLLKTEIVQAGSTVVLLDNLELLFDPDLRQDPLRLLELLARRQTVVAVWPGEVDGSDLVYAEPGHPEYRRYTRPAVILIETKQAN
jgi:predicted AAA+ superfamily ATPase